MIPSFSTSFFASLILVEPKELGLESSGSWVLASDLPDLESSNSLSPEECKLGSARLEPPAPRVRLFVPLRVSFFAC